MASDPDLVVQFAVRLRNLRDSAVIPPADQEESQREPLTMDQVAKRYNVSRATLYAAFKGERLPSPRTLRAIVRGWAPEGAAAVSAWMADRARVETMLASDQADRMKVGATTAGSVEESAAAGPDEAFGLTLFAEGVNVPMILDTGSQLSFASYEWFESHDLVKGADETPLLSMRIATGGGRTDVTVLPLARDWIISIDDSTTARCFFQVYLILNWSESPFAEVSDVGVLGRQALRDNGFRLEIRLTDEYPLRRIFGPL